MGTTPAAPNRSEQGPPAYFYCYDDNDPDSICVYQQYSHHESSQAFLKNPSYAVYLKESRLLLAGEPEITAATPVWIKGA